MKTMKFMSNKRLNAETHKQRQSAVGNAAAPQINWPGWEQALTSEEDTSWGSGTVVSPLNTRTATGSGVSQAQSAHATD